MNRESIVGTVYNAWNPFRDVCETMAASIVLQSALDSALEHERRLRKQSPQTWRVGVPVAARLSLLKMAFASANAVTPIPGSWANLAALSRAEVLCNALGEQLRVRGLTAAAYPRIQPFLSISRSDLVSRPVARRVGY